MYVLTNTLSAFDQVGDNATLYGVCLQVREIVQRPPAIYVNSSAPCLSPGGSSRFLVSAPRCYCVLTRVPFFELHYEMLNRSSFSGYRLFLLLDIFYLQLVIYTDKHENILYAIHYIYLLGCSLIAQERLNRITQVLTEISLFDYVPSPPPSKPNDQSNGNYSSTNRDPDTDWMDSAIPVDNAIALTAAAAGIICDDEVPSSSSRWEVSSPASMSASEASDHCQVKELGKDGEKKPGCFDDCASEVSESHPDCAERNNEIHDSGQTSEVGSSNSCPINHKYSSSDSLFR